MFFASLGKREILSVLIEGGGEVLSEALIERLIDRFQIYIAPFLPVGMCSRSGEKERNPPARPCDCSRFV